MKMEMEKNLQIAERLLQDHVQRFSHLGPSQLDAEVIVSELIAATRMLVNTEWGYLAAITGLEINTGTDRLEILYHFCAREVVVTLRLRIADEKVRIPSVSGIVPFADYFERELSETYGITFEPPPRLLTSSKQDVRTLR